MSFVDQIFCPLQTMLFVSIAPMGPEAYAFMLTNRLKNVLIHSFSGGERLQEERML